MHAKVAAALFFLFQASFEAWAFQSPIATSSLCRRPASIAALATKVPGSANLGDRVSWETLGFGLSPTNSHVKLTYKQNADGTGGAWSKPELVSEPYLKLHVAATALHYGQACLEGMKAFCHKDGTVHLFRPIDHASRMQKTCRRILMAELPVDAFIEAIEAVVRDNIEYVPPYGSNGALYIRPLLFGSGPRVGVQPADEYTFIALVVPVGSYYRGTGLGKPLKGLIMEEYDRAAPRGVGGVKVGGNYASDMLPSKTTKELGYDITLYLDAANRETIEEFSTSSFVGINSSERRYVTPQSESVLRSITNKSLMQLAAGMDGGDGDAWTVEVRDVEVDELSKFDEVMAVGTGAVVTPIGSITRCISSSESKVFQFGDPNAIGSVTQTLYQALRDIQNGDADDVYGWTHKVDY